MYARFTTTRMKGSAVVQGLKSLAAKLHPQLPLSTKESQRLLTALTTSFRRHLDEAHPPRTERDDSNTALRNGIAHESGIQRFHSSSADLADKHLASVLTNPLLSKTGEAKKPTLTYATAAMELQQNPAKDPILVLEEYQAKGAATLEIASLCLREFERTVKTLPEKNRQAEIEKAQAGKRTLLWLWDSETYNTDAFADDIKFMILLMRILNEEGSEKFFWEWYQLDMPIGTASRKDLKDGRSNFMKKTYHPFRWKGRLLRALVQAKLDSGSNTAGNDAVDVLLKALSIRQEGKKRDMDPRQFPLVPAVMALAKEFESNPQHRRMTVDPAKFDQFVECAAICFTPGIVAKEPNLYVQFQLAKLALVHPSAPSPWPALEVFKKVLIGDSADQSLAYFTSPRDDAASLKYHSVMVRTAALLREQGRQEADWVIAQAKRTFPSHARYTNVELDREQRWYRQWRFAPDQNPEDEPVNPPVRHVSFPSFA